MLGSVVRCPKSKLRKIPNIIHVYVSPDADSATSCEFTIVSLDGKRWRWEVGGASGAAAAAARDAWVACVEAQILASLQGRVSKYRE